MEYLDALTEFPSHLGLLGIILLEFDGHRYSFRLATRGANAVTGCVE